MRILMLGNSFTYYNDMPRLLSAMTGWEVVSHTRGGARLAEHLNPETELGARTLPALQNEKYDYVVLQEQSRAPFAESEAFRRSVRELCSLIRQNGAKPLLYATWAYRDGTEKLASTGLTYEEMDAALYAAYHQAAEENSALVADAGRAFSAARGLIDLYQPDDYHPSPAGSVLAAQAIIRCIEKDQA
ncbi:MAG: SGNH/GDSL hydrolase family protein [Clostridia bacterium]|nr:SGNH/GDSL hydrolase family protein [Clostridia bacterium]